MSQYIEFLTNHIYLFSGLAVVTVLLAYNLFMTAGDKNSVTPKRATEMINRDEAVVIDVRAMNDFQTGHIINAINVPSNAIKNQLKQLSKHKESPVIVTCRSGAQSNAACKQLREAGFEKVFNMQGGMLAWQNDDLPVSKKK